MQDINIPDEDETLSLELSNLYSPQSKYTPEEKIEVVMCYFLTGTSRQAAKLAASNGIKIPETTIRDWKTRSMWWPEVYQECKKKKNEQLDISFSQFIDQGITQIMDRVSNGDTVITKDGDHVKKPISGKDLSWMVGIIFDKRQLLRGEATARTEKVSETDRLQKLEDTFKAFGAQYQGWDAKPIDGEVVETKFEGEVVNKD